MAAGGRQQRAELHASQRRQLGGPGRRTLGRVEALAFRRVVRTGLAGQHLPLAKVLIQEAVERLLVAVRLGHQGLRIARRQVDVHQASRVADHHFAQQRTQPLAVAGVAGIAAADVLPLEVRLGLQMARFQQRQQVVKLQKVVLHGRGGEQEQMAAVQRVDELPVAGAAVLAMMGLVDDHQVPGRGGHHLGPPLTLGKRQRRQHAIGVGPVVGAVGLPRPRRDGELQVKLRPQLLVPLRHQGRRDEDQHPPHQSAQQVLPQQQAGLDRLAEPNFIGQQHPPAEMPQHLANCLDLMRQVVDAGQAFKAEQLVESPQQAEPGELQVQPQPPGVVCRGPLGQADGPHRHGDSPRGVPANQGFLAPCARLRFDRLAGSVIHGCFPELVRIHPDPGFRAGSAGAGNAPAACETTILPSGSRLGGAPATHQPLVKQPFFQLAEELSTFFLVKLSHCADLTERLAERERALAPNIYFRWPRRCNEQRGGREKVLPIRVIRHATARAGSSPWKQCHASNNSLRIWLILPCDKQNCFAAALVVSPLAKNVAIFCSR